MNLILLHKRRFLFFLQCGYLLRTCFLDPNILRTLMGELYHNLGRCVNGTSVLLHPNLVHNSKNQLEMYKEREKGNLKSFREEMLREQFSSIEQHQQSHKADTQHYRNERGEGDTSAAARLLDFGDEVGASDVNEAASGDGEHD